MRRIEVTASPDAVSVPIRRFLMDALPTVPPTVLREALRRRDVRVNDVRADESAMVPPGARVTIYTAYQSVFPVVFEDDCVLVVNKPAGLSTVQDEISQSTGGQTLLSLANEYLKPRGETAYACHRLDNPTGGLVILAKNEPARDELLKAFRERAIEKRYQCLVRGCPNPESALCEAYLIKNAQRARVRVLSHPAEGALPIAMRYRVMAPGDVSRVEVELLTGRTHQIRAHMAYLGHPILGDDKYGDRALNKQTNTTRLRLCAAFMALHTRGCLAYLEGQSFSIHPGF